MTNTRITRVLSFLVGMVLIAAMALTTTACNDNTTTDGGMTTSTTTTTTVASTEATPVGEGATQFPFEVTDQDGNTVYYTVSTDKTTVGEALLDCGLIAGDEGAYGLYVKTVNGITVDYDTDGKYWAFYVNGDYATSGVDTTAIVAGETYAFRVE